MPQYPFNISANFFLPGQEFVAQLWLSVPSPGQSIPPNAGAGFEQARVRS